MIPLPPAGPQADALASRRQGLLATFPVAGAMPAAAQRPAPLHQRSILLDGQLQDWNGAMQEVLSPVQVRQADGTLRAVVLGSYPLTGLPEADQALNAACAAWDKGRGTWPTLPTADRIRCVETFTARLLQRRDAIVRLIVWEIGKSLADAGREFDRTIEYIHATVADLKAMENGNSRFEEVDGTIAQIRRSPLGIVLCMGPFNYPLNETFTTLIPALIMGNVVLFKPPRFGVLLYEPMLEAFRVSFPAGVLNLVYGPAHVVVPHLMASGHVSVLALIGTSKVANALKKAHPKANRLRAVLGLEAKNAAIVLADADLELTVRECLAGALTFNGQRCTALKMLLVHRSIVDDFLQRFCAALESLKIGMPWEPGVMLTPMPDPVRIDYFETVVADAIAQGAQVINPGGGSRCATLYWPAVVYPVRPGMRLYREEQFGPVVPVAAFDDVEEALEYVIGADFGQQVSVFGQDSRQIADLIDPLVNQVCRVNLNCQCQRGPDVFPFTGRRDSAEGTLSVHDGLRAFSIRTMVAAKQGEATRQLLDQIVRNNQSSFLNTHYIF